MNPGLCLPPHHALIRASIPSPHGALGFQPSEYNKWKFTNSPTFLEVLEEFPSLRVPAAFLLSQLPILKPRYYSISSSLDHTPAEVHLTVAVVTYRTRGEPGQRLRSRHVIGLPFHIRNLVPHQLNDSGSALLPEP